MGETQLGSSAYDKDLVFLDDHKPNMSQQYDMTARKKLMQSWVLIMLPLIYDLVAF